MDHVYSKLKGKWDNYLDTSVPLLKHKQIYGASSKWITVPTNPPTINMH